MKTILPGIYLLLSLISFGQTGGYQTFPFLNLTYNARSAGLGGNFISVYDEDITLGISNPSLLHPEMAKNISFSSSLMPGGINHGMLGYGFDLKGIQSTMAGYIKYVSYGSFERTGINGVSEGTFTPFEMIAGAAIGKGINKRIHLGANLNVLYSQLETYNAFGASVDFAATYRIEEQNFLVTLLAKNIGYQFKSYTKGNRAPLPVEVQIATSYKVKHAPFRLTLLAHNLQKWDLTYDDPYAVPTIDVITQDTIPVKRAGFFEKLGHHFSYQLEILISKNIDLRAGFDYHRRKELALTERPGIAGFSFGVGLHFTKFRLDYGLIAYSVAGYTNMLTLTTNLSKWRK